MKEVVTTWDAESELEEPTRQFRSAFAQGLLDGFSAPLNLLGNRSFHQIDDDFDSVAHAWRSVELSLNHALLEFEREVQSIEEAASTEGWSEDSAEPREKNTASI